MEMMGDFQSTYKSLIINKCIVKEVKPQEKL